jgi:hypothetical protein
MELQRLIDRASYGPDTLRALTQAFDEAWQNIEGNFGNSPAELDAARLRLANALLSVAFEDSRDVEMLKRAGLQAMDWRP